MLGRLQADTRAAKAASEANKGTPDERVKEAMEREKSYAKLNLIYQRRNYPEEQQKLVDEIKHSLDDFFFTADRLAWVRIKNASPAIELMVLDGSDSPEAYQPLKFYVRTNDDALNQSYLFNRGLRYEWTINIVRDLSPLRHRLRDWRTKLMWNFFSRRPRPTELTLNPKTRSPRVAQFSPWPGELTVSARIVCDLRRPGELFEDKCDVPQFTKVIRRSSDVGILNALGTTELGALLFAILFAVISGLLTFYYKNPTFGTLQDYLSLFLWGVGVEQSKNFLQTLQSTRQEFKS